MTDFYATRQGIVDNRYRAAMVARWEKLTVTLILPPPKTWTPPPDTGAPAAPCVEWRA